MTVKEIREKETGHLKEALGETRKHLFDLRSQAVTEKLEDPSQLRKTRREIAQMQTILRQRELEAQPKPAKPEKATGAKKSPEAKAPVKKVTVRKSPAKKAAPKKKTTAAAAK
ncbi:MAG: 50S ribosomal protein L29 [Planctomycetota bacterium]|nr:50S ribosomal protein L29 [Planctomycetota bacterium]